MRTGTADLPLHGGRAPRWLFRRMTLLAREMGLAIRSEEGTPGLTRRIADPVWFQAFGCVLGFDWHSSGLTTTACGALKEGLRDLSHETGLFIAGGKGKTSRKTPQEIEAACWKTGQDAAPLIRASRLSAKVDSAAVQDGFQVYHHSFFFATDGSWAVVQQGMNEGTGMARRYHWLPPERFDSDPHAAIIGDASQPVLNLVASEGEANRGGGVALARETPITLLAGVTRMRTVAMPRHHAIRLSDLHPERLARVLLATYERQPEDYTALLAVPGVGRSEEHTSELQSRPHLVCRLLLEKKKNHKNPRALKISPLTKSSRHPTSYPPPTPPPLAPLYLSEPFAHHTSPPHCYYLQPPRGLQ